LGQNHAGGERGWSFPAGNEIIARREFRVWNMVTDGKQFGFTAFTPARVKFASEFGDRPVAGGQCRQRPAVGTRHLGAGCGRRAVFHRHRAASPENLTGAPCARIRGIRV